MTVNDLPATGPPPAPEATALVDNATRRPHPHPMEVRRTHWRSNAMSNRFDFDTPSNSHGASNDPSNDFSTDWRWTVEDSPEGWPQQPTYG